MSPVTHSPPWQRRGAVTTTSPHSILLPSLLHHPISTLVSVVTGNSHNGTWKGNKKKSSCWASKVKPRDSFLFLFDFTHYKTSSCSLTNDAIVKLYNISYLGCSCHDTLCSYRAPAKCHWTMTLHSIWHFIIKMHEYGSLWALRYWRVSAWTDGLNLFPISM